MPFLTLLGIVFAENPAGANLSTASPCRRGVFLTITGKVGTTSSDTNRVYEMSEQEFRALPASQVSTETPWAPRSNFAGPLLGSVLQKVGAHGNELHFFALNGFSMKLERNYAVKYGMILATSRDGQNLTRRDWGPIFAIYPVDSYSAELDTPVNISSMVWQLCAISVE
ncbi:hypothetical protein [Ensifer sp. SL37]|uniref:hypothetical protein n=1 Tax=Ensifer sp. SL37 TaxID=2995137 RepID=UPI0022734C3A|nr:hypothetical protein [Ensifer sp. SL37]MCY1740991.1 hypothetical protein [Ensifer sp. SL37]